MLNKKGKTWFLSAIMILPLVLCQHEVEGAEQKNDQAKLEKIDSERSSITLTPKAAERLGIKTEKVREEPIEADDRDDFIEEKRENKRRKIVVPYSAILYDANGNTWVYISPKPLSYERARIIIDDIEDHYVVLSDGPPIGTEVVSVGVAELYGAEKGIGK